MVFGSFEEKHEYYKFLDERCKEEGLGGIYIIETFFGGKFFYCKRFFRNLSSTTSMFFYREPNVSYNCYWLSWKHVARRISRIVVKRVIKKDDLLWNVKAGELYEYQLREKEYGNVCHGVHFGFDNTPRHGKRGYVIEPPTKEEVWKLLDEYIDEEYLFFNAWNEWAEGMVMEPTKEWGKKYLSWIKELIKRL